MSCDHDLVLFYSFDLISLEYSLKNCNNIQSHDDPSLYEFIKRHEQDFYLE